MNTVSKAPEKKVQYLKIVGEVLNKEVFVRRISPVWLPLDFGVTEEETVAALSVC